jgi:Flp pilus assembly protein TadD
VELEPKQSSLWYDLAFSYELAAKPDSAYWAISKSLELSPNDKNAKFLEARIKAKLRK